MLKTNLVPATLKPAAYVASVPVISAGRETLLIGSRALLVIFFAIINAGRGGSIADCRIAGDKAFRIHTSCTFGVEVD